MTDGEGFRCLYGDCEPGGFGIAEGEETGFFRLRNPFMWLTFAAVATAVGGGYWLVRRRRK